MADRGFFVVRRRRSHLMQWSCSAPFRPAPAMPTTVPSIARTHSAQVAYCIHHTPRHPPASHSNGLGLHCAGHCEIPLYGVLPAVCKARPVSAIPRHPPPKSYGAGRHTPPADRGTHGGRLGGRVFASRRFQSLDGHLAMKIHQAQGTQMQLRHAKVALEAWKSFSFSSSPLFHVFRV